MKIKARLKLIIFFSCFFCAFVFCGSDVHASNWGTYCTKAEAEQAIIDGIGLQTDWIFYNDSYDSNPDYARVYYYQSGYDLSYVMAYANHYAFYVDSQAGCVAQSCSGCDTWNDADGDGIADEYDLYPNDATPYNFRVASYYINDLGQKIPLTIETDLFTQGNINPITGEPLHDYFYLSDCPENEQEVISIGGVFSSSANYADAITQSYSDDDIANFTYDPISSPTGSGDDSLNVPGVTVGDSVEPSSGDVSGTSDGTASDGSDDTTVSSQKIVDNTKGIIDNQKIQLGYEKGIYDELKKLNETTGTSLVYSPSTTGTADGVTKEDLEDVMNDSGTGAYSDTTTDNLPEPVERTDTYTALTTKFNTRWGTFVSDIQSTDFYDVPFGFFDSMPTGGTSSVSYDIGQWGGSSMGTYDFDLADYNAVWDILKTVLLVIAGYSWIKIVVLKHA